MNRTAKVLLLIGSLAAGLSLYAQNGKTKPGNKGTAGKVLMPTTYLGKSNLTGGTITKSKFDELLHQGLTARDSMGNKYQVVGFQFSYAEANYYEDSLGNPIKTMDYAYEYCPGDTVTATVAASIYERSKPGDTIYFERVSVVKIVKNQPQPEANAIASKTMKFAIIKG